MRADQMLVARGLAGSRTLAQRLIAAGRVRAGDEPVRKPSEALADDTELHVEPGAEGRYASRGGLKLEAALAAAGASVVGQICLDVGQSTGGFTDCLLEAGAARVVGVDVGRDQLDARLRADPRVVCLEGLNARALDAQALGAAMPPDGFAVIVVDVSFISLSRVLPALGPLSAPGALLVALVKPQFELGPQALDRHGIVRDPEGPARALAAVRGCVGTLGWACIGQLDSPIAGGDGNRESLLIARWPASATRAAPPPRMAAP
jgi:23S rRNA (cytidine1920-2'-O)/16S rRNA (cytidine1409-2'-O)-methyltransferase